MRLTAVQNGCLWLALYALSAKAVSASRKEYWVGTAAQCEKGCVSWNLATFQTKGSELAAADELKKSLPESRAISPDATGQTDPTFRSTRIYTPVAAKQVRRRLIEQCGYRAKELPCVRTISSKIAVYGFRPQKVKKCRPIKKIPETVAIFAEVRRINAEADKAPSLPANIAGYQSGFTDWRFFARGQNRLEAKAFDHDYDADEKLVPFGMLLPRTGESYLWCTKSKVTADFMVDRLEEIWPKLDEKYRPQIRYSSG